MSANSDILNRIEDVIQQLRPYLMADGGDIRFVELTPDNIVKVELQGACGSCPYSHMTLKSGVEEALKRAVPEVKGVEEA